MEEWTIVLSILAGILAVYYYLSSKNPNVFQQHGIPHRKPLSFLRYVMEVFVFPKPYADVVQIMYKEYPEAKYIGIFNFASPTVMIRDLELLKSVTIKNFDSFEDHLFFGTDVQDPLFSNNLMTLRGDRWRDVRSLLSPAFTSSKMKAMFQLMSECAMSFTDYLMNVPPEKRIMEMRDILTRYTNDAIATSAFGISVDSMRNPENDFYMNGKKATNFGIIAIMKILLYQHVPGLSRLLKPRIVNDRIRIFFTNLVSETIKIRDEKGITRPDMLQLMMDSRGKREPGRELTVQDMTSQAFIFFLGGFDTSATAMTFTTYEIAINPDAQERLRNDIDEVLRETNGQPSYEAINGMPYLNAVINESLRLYTPIPLMDRLCVKDFELPAALPGAKPYLVKKGQVVWLPFSGFHRDPKYFSDPDEFKPERFLDGRGKDKHNPDAYHPFGVGPRMCIGNRFALLEAKVLLFYLLARCELKMCEKTPIPLKLKRHGFTLLAEGGMWLKIVPRENRPSIITHADQVHGL